MKLIVITRYNRKKAEVDKQLAGSNITREEAIRSRDTMEKKLEEMLADITEAKSGNRTTQ